MAKIVIVDDEASLIELMCELLAELGHEVTSAANGEKALRLIEQTMPALVISDVMMPVMDGYILLENIRLKKEWPTIKVVLISAASIDRRGSSRADEYMSKPYNLEELEAVVERMLAGK